jgi:chemotaxis protein MotD
MPGNERDQADGQTQPVATITVVAQETHTPPVLALSPVQQIAASIIDAASAAETQTGAPHAASVLQPPAQASLPPLQVLNITLSPPDLGEVSVKMRLSGSQLDLHIEVGEKDTVPLLDKERDSLASRLQSSGYTVDSLTIKAAENSGVSPQHQHDPSRGQAQPQQSGFQSSSFSQQSGSGPGAEARSNDRQAAANLKGAQPSGRNEVPEDGAVQISRSGDLFV